MRISLSDARYGAFPRGRRGGEESGEQSRGEGSVTAATYPLFRRQMARTDRVSRSGGDGDPCPGYRRGGDRRRPTWSGCSRPPEAERERISGIIESITDEGGSPMSGDESYLANPSAVRGFGLDCATNWT